ncbi:reverse transcriptase domain-containing protein [Tanacetum coccineum]
MKALIAELPMLSAPKKKEELIMYLAAAKEAISAVLITERDGKQMQIYFVSRALQGPEINYTPIEKLVLALYRPRISFKGQVLADFIVECPEEESADEPMEEQEELPEPWTLFTDGSSCVDGFTAGLILTNQEGVEFTYTMRANGRKNLQPNVDSRLVVNQVNGSYVAKEPGMIQYSDKVKTLASNFRGFSIKQVPRSENKKADALSKLASTSFAHLSKQVLIEELKEKSIEANEVLAVVEEEGYTWITPIYEYLKEEVLLEDKKKARAIRRKAARFGLPGEIMSDNGKQFYDNPFKDWCEKLCIRQCFASVKRPQANGLVESSNISLGEGIKARLDERSKDWMGELSHVLRAHHTMIKSSNEETPFSLTYGTEAVIPAEIGMPTLRTA